MQVLATLANGLLERLRGRARAPWTPPAPWVDLHSHVLPGIDDGAATLEAALAMAGRAEELGVTHLVATPHYSEAYNPSWERIAEALAAVREALAARGSRLVVLCGREVSFTDCHVGTVRDDARFGIAESRCVLFELSGALNRTTLIQGFFDLMVDGVRPIAAHPERNPIVQDQPELIDELRARGVLIQVDGGSVVGRHGSEARRTAMRLLANDSVDFLSSDAHRVAQFDDYSRALQRVHRRFGPARLEKLLCDAPRHVLNL
jgi:protein-tyrosine phosphatase